MNNEDTFVVNSFYDHCPEGFISKYYVSIDTEYYKIKGKEYIKKLGIEEDRICIANMTSLPPKDIDLFSVREKHQIYDPNKKIIFCLARMIPRKGIEVLIDSMVKLNSQMDDCILLLGGDGPLKEELMNKSKMLGLDNIFFLGTIDPSERSTYYAQSDVFVLSFVVGCKACKYAV